MPRLLIIAALVCVALPGRAQQTIKIGMINVLSGQFADAGIQMENGARTYTKQHGDTVAGKRIEIIRRDVGGPLPDVAKRHAQELVVRDKVDILAGFLLTPNALAAADVSAEAKKFMVVMNAATSIIITRSPYMVRTSVTLPQVMETFGTWAVKNGIKQSYTMVTDYGPGHDAEAAFQRAINKKKTRILGSGETTAEAALKSMGEAALDIITAWHYDYKLDNPLNREFVKEFNAMHGRNPDFFSAGGYDGMHVIYEALKKTGGNTDGEALIAAARGMKWDSPRGPMSIDPETRDVVQTVYIRRVQKVGDEYVNVPFDRIENVKDPAGERRKK